MARLLSTVAVLAGLISATILPARADNWPVAGYDPARSSFNSAERTLTVGNVHRLREKWQISLPSIADSTLIELDRVKIGRTYRQMLYQTTKNGITVGIDAMTGRYRLALYDQRFEDYELGAGGRSLRQVHLRAGY